MVKYFTKSFFVPTPDGRKRQIKVRGRTLKEVEEKYIKKKLEYEAGLLAINSNTPLGLWVEQWAETYKKNSTGVQTYKNMLYIVDKTYKHLYNIPIKDIRSTHIQQAINNISGQSKSKIDKAVLYIKDIFEKAVINDMIVKNPANALVKPKGTQGERRALTAEEQELFKRTLELHPEGLIFGITLACGLRPAEARALLWTDFKDGMVSVTKAVANGTNEIKEPKSKSGIREVPIPDWYLRLLQPRKGIGLVFTDRHGKLISFMQYKYAWSKFLQNMDLAAGAKIRGSEAIIHMVDQSITPYYLRHTYATNLAERGVNIKIAQYLLGHSSINTTANIYTHVSREMIAQARELINK